VKIEKQSRFSGFFSIREIFEKEKIHLDLFPLLFSLIRLSCFALPIVDI